MKPITGIILTCLVLAGCGSSGGGGNEASNSEPEIAGRPASYVRVGETYSFRPEVTDRDGDLLSFSVENLPPWAFFDAGSGEVTGFPEKQHTGSWDDIVIKVSDGTATAIFEFALDVLPQLLGRKNFSSEGVVTPTQDGYQSQGTLVMNVDGEEKRFEDSSLELKFDADGNLVEMAGDTIIPKQVSEHLALDAQVKTKVGYYSGKQINADPDIDILLKDEQYYFVYYYGQDLDMTLSDGNPANEKKITVGTPAGAEILFITDPSDVFYYYWGDIALLGVAAGKGASVHGLIPFEPALDYEQLDSFDGHIIERAKIGLGVKIFDVFEVDGTRITRIPFINELLFDGGIFDDPFQPTVEYRAGINGTGKFSFGVVGFELLSFDFTEVSATLDIGFDRQHIAMRSRTAPDVSWLPDSFVFVPESETIGDWYLDGEGGYEARLASTFKSNLPEATVNGGVLLKDGVITLAGSIDNGDEPLAIEATFFPGGLNAVVDFHADFEAGIARTVTGALDDKINEWHQAYDELQEATRDFEFELSLRGARQAIPAIVDAAIPILDAIPGSVRNAVDTAIVNYVDNYETCVTVFGIKTCSNPLDPVVNEQAIGDSKGEEARKIAADAIKPVKDALNTLKSAVNLPDDQFRAAIKAALQAVYDRRRFSKKITITYSFPLGIGTKTLYNETITRDVLTGDNLNLIKTALDNVDQIEATSSIMINAGQIYDALPVEDAINTVKQEVDDGLRRIPTVEGVGYTVDNGVYSAYAILDGKPYDVQFNVLSPSELAAGVGRLIADQMI